MDARTALYLIGLIFTVLSAAAAAGVAWGVAASRVASIRKDLNGACKKLQAQVDQARVERDEMRWLLLKIAPPDKRDEIISHFLKG